MSYLARKGCTQLKPDEMLHYS